MPMIDGTPSAYILPTAGAKWCFGGR